MVYKNQAGHMGAMSSQPAKQKDILTVDPLEALNQKMAGRTHGKSLEGLAPGKRKKRMSILGTMGQTS